MATEDAPVLVIGDDHDVRVLSMDRVGSLGFRTVAVPSAEEGLDRLRSGLPRLVPFDLLLPTMGGVR